VYWKAGEWCTGEKQPRQVRGEVARQALCGKAPNCLESRVRSRVAFPIMGQIQSSNGFLFPFSSRFISFELCGVKYKAWERASNAARRTAWPLKASAYSQIQSIPSEMTFATYHETWYEAKDCRFRSDFVSFESIRAILHSQPPQCSSIEDDVTHLQVTTLPSFI